MSAREVEELKELAAEISEAFEKHKKRNKQSQHAEYKRKRLQELAKLWLDFNNAAKEVESKITIDDTYSKMKQMVTDNYNAYYTALTNIVCNDDEEEDQYETDVDMRTQYGRLDAIARQVADLNMKIATEGLNAISPQYATIKAKKIGDIWNRIELEHEGLIGNVNAIYNQRFDELEKEVETALVTLQGQLQQDQGAKDGVKLGRVTIPKFGGDYFKWVTFRDLFSTMVLKNKQLSQSQKMQILKTNLTGEAEDLIGDLTISEVNMSCAWDRLTNRYENNKVVVYKLLDKLMNQPTPRNEAKSLKKMLDTTDQAILALSNLGRPTGHWDDWIVLCISHKFPENVQREWEKHVGTLVALPTWTQLKTFMEEQYRIMERIESSNRRPEQQKSGQLKSYQTSINSANCAACKEEHQLFSCEKWKKMEVKDRWTLAKRNKLCFNCLRQHEEKLSCDKKKPCKKCDKKHSTWLHEARKHNGNQAGEVVVLHSSLTPREILLATAVIEVTTEDGKKWKVRALVDSGSQGSMMTRRAADILQLPLTNSEIEVTGVGGAATGQTKRASIKISPRFKSSWSLEVDVYILKNLTKMLPDQDYNPSQWNHLKGLTWADPKFYARGNVDILLGMDVIVEIMKSGFVKGQEGQPIAQETKIGWIMSGKIDRQWQSQAVKCLVSTLDKREECEEKIDLTKFWEIEELHPEREMTAAEQECEKFLHQHHQKDTDGKYIAKIPFKADMGPETLGNSRGQCMARFLQLEKRFAQDPTLKEEYTKGN
ncbi:uncharacterized protein LOC119082907 [Bradysia coprophila]|uniref:uncharacterized protein LOC119082907 n=1 Tax=Bradysia coprophila TaxID=38358 RepID=UPI00187D83C3|nr:uncharacterized protein LOC119082907 [Bradysia coprophila]